MRSIRIFSLFLLIMLSVACGDDDNSSQTPTTSPDIQFTDPTNSGGCIDFSVYFYSDTRTHGLLLRGDRDSLRLTADWQQYSLSPSDTSSLSLRLYEFSQPVEDFFCDDVIEEAEVPLDIFDAEAGSVRLRIARAEDANGIYAVDVILEDVQIDDIRLDRIERSSVEVGWFPG